MQFELWRGDWKISRVAPFDRISVWTKLYAECFLRRSSSLSNDDEVVGQPHRGQRPQEAAAAPPTERPLLEVDHASG